MLRTMMTSNLIDRCARGWRPFVLAALLSLAGCGPGTGGTGTGPINSFGFSGSTGGAVFAPSTAAAGCDRVCRINLKLEEQRVELETSCLRFAYLGTWEVGANGHLMLKGIVAVTTDKGTSSRPGALTLQFSGQGTASSSVTVTVHDDQGVQLLGPIRLQSDPEVTGGSPPSPACALAVVR